MPHITFPFSLLLSLRRDERDDSLDKAATKNSTKIKKLIKNYMAIRFVCMYVWPFKKCPV